MRYAAAVALLALAFAGCAIGTPGAPTGVSGTGATLHARVLSTVDGPTTAWFSYGEGTDPAAWSDTDQQTVDVTSRDSYPVSAPITGLTPGATYHWRVCAQDEQVSPPVKICSQNQTFIAQPRLYIALGDSMTQVGSNSDQRYPERFFSFLDSAGGADRLFNIGENGQTSGGLNGQQLTVAKQHIDEPDTNTTAITIDIGGNDLLLTPVCNPESSSFNIDSCQPTIQTFATNLAYPWIRSTHPLPMTRGRAGHRGGLLQPLVGP